MDSLENLNRAIDYIEAHLKEKINFEVVARLAQCSEYHFKRMFSFLAGVTLSEYIRRRRLTLAAFDLKDRDMKVIDVAITYGYHSPDSFARAFHNLHGVTPSEARANGHSLKAYPRMTFQLTIKGGTEMNYRLEEMGAFKIVGVKNRIKLVAGGTNPEIDEMWETISAHTINEIEQISNIEPHGLLNVCANFSDDQTNEGELDYYIAAATTKESPLHFAELHIPALSWAVFEIEGDWDRVQDMWGRIYSEWFPSSGYEHAEAPEILASKEEKSEIWIPVVKK
ncbi:AraC family transcriptional regulator [Halalkalibacter alkaliphilus]|uniref:AraC family transcriptional regulator n=1 Tax=Halalkalibacter alkaliphilus TaxID=2917993 RepID=A0A9X2A0K5_9BACI|nr:AraC family transcriptional regulator [Halalkalibacter alkaliphilus]MCL7745640.1 AraC family transcriptional regulator [Halalkalibacter alkaliphilus]